MAEDQLTSQDQNPPATSKPDSTLPPVGPGGTGDKSPEDVKRDAAQWMIGLVLIIVGLSGLLVSAVFGEKLPDHGGVPAASMLFILLGIAFFFPDLLRAPDDGFSTMRVVVFIIVAVFVALAVKIGWNIRSFDEFRIDSSWVYILGLAFGSKVFSGFSENKKDKPN